MLFANSNLKLPMPTRSPKPSIQNSTNQSRAIGIASMLEMLDHEPEFLRTNIQRSIKRVMHSRLDEATVFAPHIRWNNNFRSAEKKTEQADPALDACEILELLSTFGSRELCPA
jgi:hypothetical protein